MPQQSYATFTRTAPTRPDDCVIHSRPLNLSLSLPLPAHMHAMQKYFFSEFIPKPPFWFISLRLQTTWFQVRPVVNVTSASGSQDRKQSSKPTKCWVFLTDWPETTSSACHMKSYLAGFACNQASLLGGLTHKSYSNCTHISNSLTVNSGPFSMQLSQ